jgi:hypothetical protein
MQFNENQTIELALNFILENANSIVWLIFFVALAFFVFYSLILAYHWLKYGIGSSSIWLAMIIYFVGSFILISASYLSFIAIT